MPDNVAYAIIAVAAIMGIVTGSGITWLLVEARARKRIETESRKRVFAEEETFRIPGLEIAIGKKNDRVKQLQGQFDVANSRIAVLDRELFEKTAGLAEKTIELSSSRARIAAMEAQLEEESRTARAELARHRQLSAERLEKLDEAQATLWNDFRTLFSAALAEERDRQSALDAQVWDDEQFQPVAEGLLFSQGDKTKKTAEEDSQSAHAESNIPFGVVNSRE